MKMYKFILSKIPRKASHILVLSLLFSLSFFNTSLVAQNTPICRVVSIKGMQPEKMGNGYFQMVYNEQKQVKDIWIKDAGVNYIMWTFQYNAKGQRSKVIYKIPEGQPLATYDYVWQNNKIIKIIEKVMMTAPVAYTFRYNTQGQMVEKIDNKAGLKSTYEYDIKGNVILTKIYNNKNGKLIESKEYLDYDDNPSIVAQFNHYFLAIPEPSFMNNFRKTIEWKDKNGNQKIEAKEKIENIGAYKYNTRGYPIEAKTVQGKSSTTTMFFEYICE